MNGCQLLTKVPESSVLKGRYVSGRVVTIILIIIIIIIIIIRGATGSDEPWPAEQLPLAVFPDCTRRYWVDMWSAHRIKQLHFQLSKPVLTLTIGIMFILCTCMHFCVWGNFTKMVRVCADRLWSGPPLPEVWETLLRQFLSWRSWNRVKSYMASTSKLLLSPQSHGNIRGCSTARHFKVHGWCGFCDKYISPRRVWNV
jgi:hypothetical protein